MLVLERESASMLCASLNEESLGLPNLVRIVMTISYLREWFRSPSVAYVPPYIATLQPLEQRELRIDMSDCRLYKLPNEVRLSNLSLLTLADHHSYYCTCSRP